MTASPRCNGAYLCCKYVPERRVVFCNLEKLVKDYIDPLQFAYRKNRSTNDAILYSLEDIYSHLEKTGNTVRLTFFDFSSAQYSNIYLFKNF